MNAIKNRTFAIGAVLLVCMTVFAGMCVASDDSDAVYAYENSYAVKPGSTIDTGGIYDSSASLGGYAYTLPSGFSASPSSTNNFVVRLTVASSVSPGEYDVTYTRNVNGSPVSVTHSIYVNSYLDTIQGSSSRVASGKVGTYLNWSYDESEGGEAVLTSATIQAGTIAPGLSLSHDGTNVYIRGTPTVAGIYAIQIFTVAGSDYGDLNDRFVLVLDISSSSYDTWTGSTNYTNNLECRGIGSPNYTVNTTVGAQLNDVIGCEECEGYARCSWNTVPAGITTTPLNIKGGWDVHITGAFQTAGTYVLSVTCPDSCGTTTITYVVSNSQSPTYDTWTGSTDYTHTMYCKGLGDADSYTVNTTVGAQLNDIIGCEECEGYATYSWNTVPSGITVTPLNIYGGWDVHITGAFQTAGTYVLSVTCPENCGTTTITYVVSGSQNTLSVTANNISGVSKLTYTNQIGASANNGATLSYAVKSCTGGTATVNGTGLVTYKAPTVTSTTTYTVTVTVTATFGDGQTMSRDVSFSVNVDPVLSFTNAATSGTLSVKGA